MSNIKTKKLIVPLIYICSFFAILLCVFLIGKSIKNYFGVENKINYSTSSVFNQILPVLKEEEENKIIKPFTSEKVTIGKNYYDYEADKTEQEQALIYYENTYIQNSGVDYVSDEAFDVISVMNGTVINVKTDKILGNIVEIKHENDLITIYQGLENVVVKKDQAISQGDSIGTSSKSQVNPDFANTFHFEVYNKGKLMDPENFYNLELKDLQ